MSCVNVLILAYFLSIWLVLALLAYIHSEFSSGNSGSQHQWWTFGGIGVVTTNVGKNKGFLFGNNGDEHCFSTKTKLCSHNIWQSACHFILLPPESCLLFLLTGVECLLDSL